MTQLLTANIGSYPRVGEDKDHQRYRRGVAHFDSKEISAHAFRDVEQSVVQEIIQEEIGAELDEVTDGLVSWIDPVSHFCRNIAGIEPGGLTRYFNTNFYYRVPTFVARPKPKEPVLLKEFQYAQSVCAKPVRSVVTGPFTLASHTRSRIKFFDKPAVRLDFFTEIVSREVAALAKAGAPVIQIDEPSLAANPGALQLVRKTLEKIIPRGISTHIALALYFQPLAALWEGLQTLPVDGLQLDFTCDGKNLLAKMLANPGKKHVGLGLVDGRNTRPEPVEASALLVRRWFEKTPATRCYVTPSCGLELLPRAAALSKIKQLQEIRKHV